MNSSVAQNKQTITETDNVEKNSSKQSSAGPGNYSLTVVRYFQTDRNENWSFFLSKFE
jgi:hypothetical protein